MLIFFFSLFPPGVLRWPGRQAQFGSSLFMFHHAPGGHRQANGLSSQAQCLAKMPIRHGSFITYLLFIIYYLLCISGQKSFMCDSFYSLATEFKRLLGSFPNSAAKLWICISKSRLELALRSKTKVKESTRVKEKVLPIALLQLRLRDVASGSPLTTSQQATSVNSAGICPCSLVQELVLEA